MFEWNQEEGRAYFIPEKHISLNGNWKFFWSDTPEGIPANFYVPGFNDRKWSAIPVPCNWEMQGFGDKLFRNVSLSFKANPPFVPREYNPSGAYRKTFTIPAAWKGEQVFLRFEKVASASFVWLNGQEVGYNEGGQEPAEYNITPFLKSGTNTLAVMVTKYSDGYYLEDQDYWRLAGIFDDVWLYAAPTTRLFDWQVITDLDETYTNADLQLNVDIKRYTEQAAAAFSIKASLFDNNQAIAEWTSDPFTMDKVEKKTLKLSKEIKNPKKWTAETPHLYTLKMQLQTSDGKVQDRAEARIGFKETEIKGEVFYLNGVPLKVHAQNSHMQHPESGHTMDEATIRKDMELLKQFNFNGVRTSHYPPVNKYLELADEYGLYIIDETGDEAHATDYGLYITDEAGNEVYAPGLSKRPEYAEMYRERSRQMVLRDRNHPSVLFWSAGNESGGGNNIAEVIKEGKKYDPTRYWMYGDDHYAEDIIGPRYPTPTELEMQFGLPSNAAGSNRRPSFMDEYLSVAGNGGGALDDYWKVIYTYPRLMGGAIWDFVSPGLTEKIRSLTDISTYHTPSHLMGNATLVKEGGNTVLDLNGHDQWVEVYRQDNVEITSNQLTLTLRVYPRKLSSSCGSYLTKGSYQFGIQQKGKDSLEFYIYTNKKHAIFAPLPADWEYRWHDIKAVYDGKEISLYIDGAQKASGKVSGNIRNFPFPVNIGRNAELHGQETSVYICDALMDNVGIFTEAVDIKRLPSPTPLDPQKAVLWLDFEKEQNEGTFFSYGIGARTYGSIWSDRKPQPEMWQMKKTVQPLAFTLHDAEKGAVEVWNRNHFLDAGYYRTQWFLEADGKILQQGELNLKTPPLSKEIIHIPFTKPTIEAGKEYRILISSSLKKDEIWAKAGHEVAWDQLELPWFGQAKNQADTQANTNLPAPTYSETAEQVIVSGTHFSYTFDKKKGQLVSIVSKGKELLRSPLELNLWRAPLANELDEWNSETEYVVNRKEGFGKNLASEMYAAGVNSLVHQPIAFKVEKNDKNIRVHIEDISLFGRSEYGIRSESDLTISGDGKIILRHTLKPEGRMPLWFPRIGLTLTLDKSLNRVDWYGRGPQENYPDRKTGYKIGIYHTTVQEMYEPYLLPQDYGLRTDNRWVSMTDNSGEGLQFSVNEHFNFNAHPFSTDNLTKATYTYQLKEQNGITFNLDYADSGVGCTARGIFPAYKVVPQTFEREIIITLKRK
ncbi:beta-galactosidase [Bacteroidia bacterium]|nr:beta-galactosidase [Bacteroidia bacterium]